MDNKKIGDGERRVFMQTSILRLKKKINTSFKKQINRNWFFFI